ncbi:16S rRNA (guanine(966)-N(2))-methyltransferase RsmD [Noviherbaspirillum cavernae]|uniref:16S rRNA (Guanine(966)-N(2))-methyltransferase RsmD n=1 Tax=Noviherbaspirillum cavernae TaxID=2320862 RepID=A0A418WXN9_9BURK|nr:16S rRNA (guanine(966)-N(2))-methyltransferase RsmD [Noviherbaspirillum cavernae]RJG04972.1 16S rRNA (guanine(966)-N(2))-methyltransferase RsmD [Noviherbaspirillum cavernae]
MQKKTIRKSSPARGGHSSVPRQVRIIGGQWKRTPLAVSEAEGLRPTPDRVRETVFNWINHLFDGTWHDVSCLDLFAGTGALGFEAASRGAARVVMIESNMQAVRQLEATRAKLKAEQIDIVRGDALSAAQRLASRAGTGGARFDVIFLDPPYHQDLIGKMLPLCSPLLSEGGLVYVEAEEALDSGDVPEWLHGWQVVRADKAGMVFYHLLQRNTSPHFEA